LQSGKTPNLYWPIPIPGLLEIGLAEGRVGLLSLGRTMSVKTTSTDRLEEALAAFVADGPHRFTYHLRYRSRETLTFDAEGVIDVRIWRSSMNYEYFSVASDGKREWKGPPELAVRDAPAGPPTLLQPLWLIWCLFGAHEAVSTPPAHESDVGCLTLKVACDLEAARRLTGIDLPNPPDGPGQTVYVSLHEPESRLRAFAADAYLGGVRIEFVEPRVGEDRISWDRVGALGR
jgi:hypothetical protein